MKKKIEVYESALDSLKLMGEADAARIKKLEAVLKHIRLMLNEAHQLNWLNSCEFAVKFIDEALK